MTSLKGRPQSAEHKLKRLLAHQNRSPEAEAERRQKISEKMKGIKKSPETVKRMILAQTGKPKSEATKEKISNALRGSKSPRWIADRTKLKKSDRHGLDMHYVEWVRKIKNRDVWKCQLADKNCDGRLEAHHIQGWVEFPKLRYKLTNGITLCRAHHPKRRAEEKRLAPLLQALLKGG